MNNLTSVQTNSEGKFLKNVQFQERYNLLQLIKSCEKVKDIVKLQRLHADILHKDLIMKDVYVATSLLTTYAKCGALEKAKEVFEQLLVKNVVTWNGLITGYVRHGLVNEALECYGRMRSQNVAPDVVTYTCILKACGIIGSLEIGEPVAAEVQKQGLFRKDIMLGNTLVDMYAKCGALKKACEVFEQLPVRGVVSWNILISGYAQNGLAAEAVKCFRQMQDEGILADSVTCLSILKACVILGDLEMGQDIDAKVRKQGLLHENPSIGNALVDMYAKCGAIGRARDVFDKLQVRNVIAWTALITGYVQHGPVGEALRCFRQMQKEGVSPNNVTFMCILKACSILGSLEVGENIDAELRKQGLLQKDVMLGTTLVDMYAKCGALDKAQDVLQSLPTRNVVSWSALIVGYTQHGQGGEALKCFKKMQDDGVSPDLVTYICVLKACGIAGCLETGKDIDREVRKQGLLQKDNLLGTTLVDMYIKCNALEKAQEVFDQLLVRDVVSWSALIVGYAEHGFGNEALKCFKHMKDHGVSPSAITYIGVLKACGIVGSLEIGEDIYAEIRKHGLLRKHIVLGGALVDMYAKCGVPKKAHEVFDQLPVQDLVSWTSLLFGHAQLGQAKTVLDQYRIMIRDGIMPDLITFLVLLNACSHGGLLEEGEQLFNEMLHVYHLNPTLEHYTCMIDLFGRAGHFDKAEMLLNKVPNSDYGPLFLAILGACGKWGNVKLGRWAFEQAVKLDEKCASAYVCMKNIYTSAGMQMEADEVESQRVENKAWMIPGCSWWSDMSRNVHSFVAGDDSHPQTTHIYAKLEEIHMKLAREGYSPGQHCLSRLIPCEDNEHDLCGYSENLALACALINSPKGAPLRVTKNMKMCEECHSSTTLISVFEKCRIQVNDPDRVHIFENGRCICEDTYDVELSSYGFRQFSYA